MRQKCETLTKYVLSVAIFNPKTLASRRTLEKSLNYNVELHNLCVDYRQAYDALDRVRIVKVILEFSILTNLRSLIGMTLEGTRKCKAKDGELVGVYGQQRIEAEC